MINANEMMQILLDRVASGQLARRRFLTAASAAGRDIGLSGATVHQALAAGETQAANQGKLEGAYDYIVVGAGASGSIVAGELSKTGAKILVVESGDADTAPSITNPSIWFYNVGGAFDWNLPIAPVPQLINRKFKHGARARSGRWQLHPMRRCGRVAWSATTMPGSEAVRMAGALRTAGQAARIFTDNCALCHGEGGRGGVSMVTSGARLHREVVDDKKIVGIDETTTTIADCRSYAATLFDHIRRAMPWTAPRSLTDDRVDALTAYILGQNKLIDGKAVINAQTLPRVQMPNRNGFIRRFPERMPK
jgi:mono/diheme cytochrome c family protein